MDEEEESFPSVAKAGISTNSPIGEVAPRNFPAPCVEETLGAASDPGGQQADILQYLITRRRMQLFSGEPELRDQSRSITK